MADEGKRKHKRFSKNKKRYWKRHADVKDVEEFLEDQRLQERTGGLVAEKADAELFFVDSVIKEESEVLPLKRRRREPKLLKCHSALLPNPKIKPIKIPHNVKKEKTTKMSGPGNNTAKRKAKLSKQLSARRMRQAQREQRQNATQTVPKAEYDMWAKSEVKNLSPADGDVAPNAHYLKIMKITRPNVPHTFGKKPSLVPAVELAHPGASYNPEYDEHQDLLQKALNTEAQKVNAEMKIQRALDDMFPSAKNAPTEISMRNELAEGLFNESDSEDEALGETSALSVNPPIRREDKKTESQRKKQLKQHIEKEKAEKVKAERIRKNEIFRLKSMKKDIKMLIGKQKERAERKQLVAEQNKNKTKRLGKNRFEEPDLEIKLSDEIKGSLRLLKPEGDLLEDRFKSLQKRNMIEPRQRAKKTKKYKLKRYVKKSHKEEVTV